MPWKSIYFNFLSLDFTKKRASKDALFSCLSITKRYFIQYPIEELNFELFSQININVLNAQLKEKFKTYTSQNPIQKDFKYINTEMQNYQASGVPIYVAK